MTDKEKAIVMAYTGICMLSGDKFQIFHKYVEDIMGKPIYTHEMAIKAVDDEIKERAKADFIALCAEQEPRTGHWFIDERPESNREIICSICEQPVFKFHKLDFDYRPHYCPNCGAKMQ